MPNDVDTQSLEELIGASIDELAEPVEEAAPEPEPAPEPEAEEAAPVEEEAPKAERARDREGKFTKGQKAPTKAPAAPKGVQKAAGEAAAEAEGKPAGASPPSAPAGQPAPFKAPQSWKPAVRELASKLPAEFRPIIEESMRREQEITRTLQETAEARRTVDQVRQTLAPYETIARANGMDAMSYAGSVLQTAATLTMGSPQQKAQAFAALIQQFRPDIDEVAKFLNGQAPMPQQQAPAAAQAPDIESIVAQQMEKARAKQDAEAFLGTQPEFLDDVRDDMLLVMQRERAAGRNISWQQAYDKACKVNEDVQAVLAQRKQAEAAKAKIADAQRARKAVTPRPSAPVQATQERQAGRSPEDDVMDALAELEAR